LARYVHFTRGQPKAVNKKGFAPRLIMPGTRKTKEEDNGQAGQGDKILLENRNSVNRFFLFSNPPWIP
jgi:hypothetical protein